MNMDFNEYQMLAQRTSNTERPDDKLLNGVMGLNGEAGEAIDAVKKHLFQGHALDENHLVEELGDVLWYIAEIASGIDWPLSVIAERNIGKLRRRYPKGFDSNRSINRGGKIC
jgi:NTP pyrophosphatase (non-canonical NTP hydrolase)